MEKRIDQTKKTNKNPISRSGQKNEQARKRTGSSGVEQRKKRVVSGRTEQRHSSVKRSAPRPGPDKQATSHTRKPVKKSAVRRKRVTSTQVIVFFVGVIFVGYLVGYAADRASRPSIAYATIENGSIDIPMIHRGIIIRDEVVYKAGQKGFVYYSVADKEKVKAGTSVCQIIDEAVTASLTESLGELEQNIMVKQKQRTDITAYQSDVKKTNKIIKDSIDGSIYKLLGSDISLIYTIRADLDKNINLRNQKLLNEDRGSVSDLVEQKAALELSISENTEVIKANEGGIIVYLTDGMEEALTLDKLDNITLEQTTMYVEAKYDVQGSQIESGDNVFKIIASSEWYIASYLDNGLTINYKEGDAQTIYVELNGLYQELPVTISRINRGAEKTYVSYKATKSMLDYADVRSVGFKTESSVYTGLKIPNTAIIDRTFINVPNKYITVDNAGVKSVTRRDANGDARISINSQSRTDEAYTYVSKDSGGLILGDRLVSPDDNELLYSLEETSNVNGIFRVNNGIAEFVPIYHEGELKENSGYCILDPAINPRLKVQDRIIPEPKNIVDGQKIN